VRSNSNGVNLECDEPLELWRRVIYRNGSVSHCVPCNGLLRFRQEGAIIMAIVRNPNYKDIRQLLADRREFVHSHSMRAELVGNLYVVWSYSTVIGMYDFNADTWTINTRKYSVTTSKQQNILRAVTRNSQVIETDEGDLRYLSVTHP
jgi:hypothetical protein